MVRITLCLLLFVTGIFGAAWCQADIRSPRLKICLNGEWLRCAGGDGWKSVELDAPLQPLDINHGGFGKLFRFDLEIE